MEAVRLCPVPVLLLLVLVISDLQTDGCACAGRQQWVNILDSTQPDVAIDPLSERACGTPPPSGHEVMMMMSRPT